MYLDRKHDIASRSRRFAARAGAIAACSVIAACGDSPTTVAPVQPVRAPSFAKVKATTAGRIVFSADIDAPGNNDIYSMNPDGTDIIRITTDASADWAPSVSANGARIAFMSNRDGTTSIWVMDANGGNVSRVTPAGMTGIFGPVISRSGTAVAFTRSFSGADDEIYTIDVNGSALTQLTSNAALDGEPSWGLKDQTLAFVSDRDGNYEIYSMNRDGTGVQRLTNEPAPDVGPSWSPDGRQIAFASVRDGFAAVYTMTSDGKRVTRITSPSQYGGDIPSWSPSQAQIAFQADPSGVAVINVDGSGFSTLFSGLTLGLAWGR